MAAQSVFTVRQEQFSSKTSRIFRQVSRDVSGESSEPTEGDIVVFGRTKRYKTEVVSVACGHVQKTVASGNHDDEEDDLYHWITFLFVTKYCQGQGYGRAMLTKIEETLWSHSHATIRIQSASRAVPFFKKMGYSEVGEPVKCVYSGSALFKSLQLMEKHFGGNT